MSAILSQWRAIVYGLLAAGFIIMGWKVNQWRVDASQLAAAKAALQNEIAANIQIDVDRALVGSAVDTLQEEFRVTYLTQVKKVRERVQDNPDCALGADIVGLLNDANRLSPSAPQSDEEGRAVAGRQGASVAPGSN